MWGNTITKQKSCGETLQQSTVFLKIKLRSKILNQLNMKKIKSTKTILEKKIHKKKEKKSCKETLWQSIMF